MSRFKLDWGCAIVVERCFPARDAYTPFVAWVQPGKSPFRAWRDQIVPVEHGKIEKFLSDFYANRVQPNIFWPGATKSVAIESGHRIATTASKFSPENICGHERKVANDSLFQSKSQSVIRRKVKMLERASKAEDGLY